MTSPILIVWAASLFSGPSDYGRLSAYHPNDGHNAGRLSCRGEFTWEQNHIAYRKWRKMGCKRPVLVCSMRTARCVLSQVRDAGPFGIYTGKLKNCKAEGRWKLWTRIRPPKGWKFRAVADLSWNLWKQLGKPRFFSHIALFFLKKTPSESKVLADSVCTFTAHGATI